MTGSTQTRGPCIYCGREMTRGGLARHLKTCAHRLDAQAAADKTERKRQPLYLSLIHISEPTRPY